MRPLSTFALAAALGWTTAWCDTPAPPPAPTPDYIGRDRCIACHAEQGARWKGSHHDLAMQEASETSVLGDFSDRTFENFGLTTRFYRKDGRFMVSTDGPDGKLHDYPIAYTFGVYPLQQYLIAFPDGRYQTLDIAWDSRPKTEGGQRWFHLHPEDPVPAGDVLHWTGPNLNWNYMCADCHSTNLRKGYDPAKGSYHTTWSEINVSCEACHGPGSAHGDWAERKARGEPAEDASLGLTVRLNQRVGVAWTIDPVTGKARRSTPRQGDNEIEVCARCHARRSQVTDQIHAGQPFLDGFLPSLLTAGLYHADGQVQDEVYDWASFLQSKMYQAGVTCSDCHDPHAAAPRLPGDSVCAQCHPAERFATKAHHFHDPEGKGASCVECHMPPTTYMGVDARHDHSMRVPRPDQSVALGTPNACNTCHADKTPQWAAAQVEGWYGHPARGWQGYAQALTAARQRLPGAFARLQALIDNPDQPTIAKATALAALGAYPSREALMLIQQGLQSDQPVVRLGALEGLAELGPGRAALAIALLWDDTKAVRIAAARLLAAFPPAQLPAAAQERLEAGLNEYIAAQTFNAERPESQVNLGGLYADLKRPGDAEVAYREAIRLQPRFIPAYVNLAQFFSSAGRESEADGTLRAGLEASPEEASLNHALGLSLIRQKRPDLALPHLASAASKAPEQARYTYVYGIALQSAGRLDEALAALDAASARHPGDTAILMALATYSREAGHREAALGYARRLQTLAPGDRNVQGLIQALEADGK
jgi:tetratricopeptide (TPR) repeat protein